MKCCKFAIVAISAFFCAKLLPQKLVCVIFDKYSGLVVNSDWKHGAQFSDVGKRGQFAQISRHLECSIELDNEFAVHFCQQLLLWVTRNVVKFTNKQTPNKQISTQLWNKLYFSNSFQGLRTSPFGEVISLAVYCKTGLFRRPACTLLRNCPLRNAVTQDEKIRFWK